MAEEVCPRTAEIVRKEMIERLSSYISQKRHELGPLVVGITGMDTSGKSEMTKLLARELENAGHTVQVVHLDDFHRSRAERYRVGLLEPVQYYEHSFDFEWLITELLIPIRNEGQLEKSLTCLDVLKDTWTIERRYSVNADTIVLLEGVFLFRAEISQFLDLVIFLQVDESTVVERARLRDLPIQGEEVWRKYQKKYLPAQRAYLEEYPPERNAGIILDNNDWANPKVIKWPE